MDQCRWQKLELGQKDMRKSKNSRFSCKILLNIYKLIIVSHKQFILRWKIDFIWRKCAALTKIDGNVAFSFSTTTSLCANAQTQSFYWRALCESVGERRQVEIKNLLHWMIKREIGRSAGTALCSIHSQPFTTFVLDGSENIRWLFDIVEIAVCKVDAQWNRKCSFGEQLASCVGTVACGGSFPSEQHSMRWCLLAETTSQCVRTRLPVPGAVIWLILPELMCSFQRLSHACIRTNL